MKYYSLLGIGLLGAASLSSCQTDDLVQDVSKVGVKEDLSIYTAVADIEEYESDNQNASSRANVQENGKSFMWNAGDKVTVWDGVKGYTFVTTDESLNEQPSRKASFTGEASFNDQTKVWGVYPEAVGENPLSFTLSENAVQPSDGLPALQKTMYMLAEGVVDGTQVKNLNFKHLTALYQFDVTTTRDEQLTLKSIQVEADSDVFPTHLEVATDDTISYTYSEKKTMLTLDMSERSLSKGETVTGYLSFFPTEGLTGETVLTFRIIFDKPDETNGMTEEVLEVKKAKVSALYSKADALVPTEGYVSGKRYIVNLNVGLSGGDNGYTQDGTTYTVLSSDGLKNIPSEVWADASNVIKLGDDFDMSEVGEWNPVSSLKATLDGNGKTLSNLTISSSATDGAGLFVTNEGVIKKLVLDQVSVNGYDKGNLGLLAATNKGTIQDCVIRNAVVTVSGSGAAGLISGINEGLMQDCVVEGESVLTSEGNNACGGMAGKSVSGTMKGCAVKDIMVKSFAGDVSAFLGNAGDNTTLEGCSVSGTIDHQGENTWIGGLIGMAWTQNLRIDLCYAAVTIKTSDGGGSSIGGVVGQGGGSGSKTLSGVYSTSSAEGTSASRFSQIVRNAVSVTCKECYFTSGQACEQGDLDGATLSDAAAIRAAVSKLNAAVNGSDYEFVVNEGDDGNIIPLILQKKQQ